MQATKTWLLAALSAGILAAPAAGSESPLQIHVYVQPAIAAGGLDAALRIATGLLGKAGVVGHWRVCTLASPCVNPEGFRPTITVIVRRAVTSASGACGRAAREPDRATGTVLIDYDCVADVTARVRFSSRGRLHPHLASLDLWEVAGLVMAHEVGHVAGLPHANQGIMHARLDTDDLVAFRRDALEFSRGEAATMRASLASMVERTARRREP